MSKTFTGRDVRNIFWAVGALVDHKCKKPSQWLVTIKGGKIVGQCKGCRETVGIELEKP